MSDGPAEHPQAEPRQIPERPPTMMGVPYFEGSIVGVIDDATEAGQAVAALHASGFAQEDAGFATGDQVVERHEAFLANRGLLDRVGAALAAEESGYVEEYIAEMRKGGNLIVTRVPTDDELQRAVQILKQHHAHRLRHYKKATVEDL